MIPLICRFTYPHGGVSQHAYSSLDEILPQRHAELGLAAIESDHGPRTRHDGRCNPSPFLLYEGTTEGGPRPPYSSRSRVNIKRF